MLRPEKNRGLPKAKAKKASSVDPWKKHHLSMRSPVWNKRSKTTEFEESRKPKKTLNSQKSHYHWQTKKLALKNWKLKTKQNLTKLYFDLWTAPLENKRNKQTKRWNRKKTNKTNDASLWKKETSKQNKNLV